MARAARRAARSLGYASQKAAIAEPPYREAISYRDIALRIYPAGGGSRGHAG
jgi:hypothetical protein